MLSDLIKNLQNRPEHAKVRILYFFAALSVILVLMIWISSFGEYKAALNNPIGDNEAAKTLKASVIDSVVENQNSNFKSQNNSEIMEIGNLELDAEKETKIGGTEKMDKKSNAEPKKEDRIFKLPVE